MQTGTTFYIYCLNLSVKPRNYATVGYWCTTTVIWLCDAVTNLWISLCAPWTLAMQSISMWNIKGEGIYFKTGSNQLLPRNRIILSNWSGMFIWILSGQGFVQVWMSWIHINGVVMLYWWVKAFVLFRPRIRCCLGSEQRLSQQESATGNLWVKVQAESGMIGTFKKPERVIRELKEKTGLRAG